MATKVFTAEHLGPLLIDVTAVTADIRVTVEDRERAEVTVRTDATNGPAADAVNTATCVHGTGRMVVRVNERPTGGGRTVIHNHGGGTIIQGNVFGMSIGSGSVTVIGGAVVGGTVVVSHPIVISVRLPRGCALNASTTSGDVYVTGALDSIDAHTVSGDIGTGEVRAAKLDSTSGDLTITGLTGHAGLKTVGGDVHVLAAGPGHVRAQSVSGDVTVLGAQVEVDARSVSGRVRTGGAQ